MSKYARRRDFGVVLATKSIRKVYLFNICFALFGCLLLSGCAGSATGLDTSAVRSSTSVAYRAQEVQTENPILVAVRFPGLIRPAARQRYINFYLKQIGLADQASPAVNKGVLSANTKTAYFAQELYVALQKRLPEKTVILAPYEIDVGSNGRLVAKDSYSVKLTPSVLQIDFFTYHNPAPDQIMDANALTFGDLVTPLFVIHTSKEVSPKTQGLLAASEPILLPSSRSDGGAPLPPGRISFVNFLNNGSANISSQGVPVYSSRPGRAGSVLRLPMEKLHLAGSVLKAQQEPGTNQTRHMPFAAATSGYADLVLELLNDLGGAKAIRAELGQWASYYDRRNGEAAYADDVPQQIAARREMLDEFYQGEKEFLTAHSAALVQATYRADFGTKMRELIFSEYRHLSERRSLANQENLSTGIGVGLAALGGFTAFKGDAVATVAASNGMQLALAFSDKVNQESQIAADGFGVAYRDAYSKRFSTSVKMAKGMRVETFHKLGQVRKNAKASYIRWWKRKGQ